MISKIKLIEWGNNDRPVMYLQYEDRSDIPHAELLSNYLLACANQGRQPVSQITEYLSPGGTYDDLMEQYVQNGAHLSPNNEVMSHCDITVNPKWSYSWALSNSSPEFTLLICLPSYGDTADRIVWVIDDRGENRDIITYKLDSRVTSDELWRAVTQAGCWPISSGSISYTTHVTIDKKNPEHVAIERMILVESHAKYKTKQITVDKLYEILPQRPLAELAGIHSADELRNSTTMLFGKQVYPLELPWKHA